MKTDSLASFVSIVVLSALASVAQAQGTWTSHGPVGGGVANGIAVGDRVVYAATPTGVFRSRDGGATWTQTTLAGEWIEQVVARPETTVVLAVASPGTLYLSSDEGDTWASIPGVPSQAAAIDPGQPSTLYSGAYQGIWRSTDSGANWQQLSTAPAGDDGPSFALDSHAIYLLGWNQVTSNHPDLYRSLDGGDRWTSVSTPIPSPTAVAAGVASGLVYVAGSGSLCRSADAAATWSCSSFPGSPFLIFEIPGDGSGAPPRILALSDAGAYSSSDGTTWTPEAIAGGAATLASDASGSLVLAGTSTGIFRSSDRGGSWTPASVGLGSASISAFAVDPSDPSTVWAIGGSGLFRSGDAGLSWTLDNGPMGSFGALAIDPAHPSTLYAGGSEVSRSLDMGAAWSSSSLPGGAVVNVLAPDPGLPERVWAASSGGLFRSDDGAQTWSSGPAIAQEIFSIVFDAKRPGTMYAGSYFDNVDGGYYPGPEGGSIFVSRDSGASWTKNGYDFESNVVAVAVDPFLDGVLYVGTSVSANAVYRTLDGGVTWLSVGAGLGQSPVGIVSLLVDPVRPGHLYCSTYDGTVYRSIDGAQTFQPLSSRLPGFSGRPLVISADGRWLHAGTFGNGVFDLDLEGSYPCSPTESRLCLVGGRYSVELLAASAGNVPNASGTARSLGDRAGYFALPFATGDATLPEVVVKMLPAGSLGGDSAPVFYSSLTTLPYLLSVTDTVTGTHRVYASHADAPLCGGADLSLGASAITASAHSRSAAAETSLSLLNGRFSISLDAHRPDSGDAVTASVMAARNQFGFFSFPDVSDDPQFPEVVVKMIDATAFDGHFWFFHSDLTSLDYTLTVKDLVTGVTRTYDSSQPFCGGADTESFTDSP